MIKDETKQILALTYFLSLINMLYFLHAIDDDLFVESIDNIRIRRLKLVNVFSKRKIPEFVEADMLLRPHDVSYVSDLDSTL